MASRQNREARDDVPTYGAPMGREQPSNEERERRAEERRRKLAKEPTPEERAEAIEGKVEAGKEESARLRRNRRTQAPKPAPGQQVTDTEGKSTTEVIRGRSRDIEDTLTEMETGEARPERETDAARQRRQQREREEASRPELRQRPKR